MCGRFLDSNPTESPQADAAVRSGRTVGFSFPKSYRFPEFEKVRAPLVSVFCSQTNLFLSKIIGVQLKN